MATPASLAFLTLPALLFLSLFTSPSSAENILYTNEVLYSDNSLTYNYYRLTMQRDCNLVLYDNGYPVWATNTGGLASGCYLKMQGDGNLVVYSNTNRAIWASNTGDGGNANYVLVLQRDRNVVVYGTARWASHSNAFGSGVVITDGQKASNVSTTTGDIAMVTKN
ncbi:hypothetical protein QJS10_CPB14g00719 [Acorus calamus]|uniref:Bulb-type lectin domain-containing protein n=1 Tax=Acorus calamus TaxID=4465 RepID=A0AAV9DEW9_ACOCL|nr:hypothetical protein QJS10_CPB14g00719 [Acorus calamus]